MEIRQDLKNTQSKITKIKKKKKQRKDETNREQLARW